MGSRKTKRSIGMVALSVLVIVLLAFLAGCGNDAEETPTPEGDTAKALLPVAESALATMAPDAKLLVVQTAESATATSTPVWAYLFGSPDTDATFVVYVVNGQPMGASQYGTAGLSEAEWAKVPDTGDWEIDSDEAYEKAVSSSDAEDSTYYSMGLQTYVPESTPETQTVDPFTWYVSLDTGGEAPEVIQVDAKTGEVSKE